jgi:hypothetical protein
MTQSLNSSLGSSFMSLFQSILAVCALALPIAAAPVGHDNSTLLPGSELRSGESISAGTGSVVRLTISTC